ncbi:MAG: hypothetical protein ACOX6I_04385 [Syntrophomonadaceae bacterium]
MNNLGTSKFELINGQPDVDQVEAWAESFFESMLNMVNGFYCRLDIKEVADNMGNIPFEQMVREQLRNENEEVINIAVAKVRELAKMQIEYLQAYSE